ncbi:MAG: hypothetical protein KGR26_04635, partial [Cyanobacteria bacterium REEB65]|nr:hypothetical protein [Cyanobacteria bacterium REEB65]
MRCRACGRDLQSSYVSAGSVAFHLECFRCAICDKPIAGRFFQHDGEAVHEACYLRHAAERCA